MTFFIGFILVLFGATFGFFVCALLSANAKNEDPDYFMEKEYFANEIKKKNVRMEEYRKKLTEAEQKYIKLASAYLKLKTKYNEAVSNNSN